MPEEKDSLEFIELDCAKCGSKIYKVSFSSLEIEPNLDKYEYNSFLAIKCLGCNNPPSIWEVNDNGIAAKAVKMTIFE